MTLRRGVLLVLVAAVAVALVWWVWGRPAATMDPSAPLSGERSTVLLIPGYGGDQASLASLAQALGRDGWTAEVVDIGSGHGDITAYAREVAARARQYASEGVPVALVGFSMGGLIARAAVDAGAASAVTRVVTVGTPHGGTSLAGLGELTNSPSCDTACRQMAPGSAFLDDLPVAGDAQRWLAIYTENDDVVRPAETAALEGATVARLQDFCPGRADGHGDLVVDPFTLRATGAFLDTGTVPSGCP